MKLRNKIAAIFILLFGLLQIGTSFTIYHFSKNYIEKEFFEDLAARATLAGQTYLGKDEFPPDIYEDIRIHHLNHLPHEKELIFSADSLQDKSHEDIRKILPESFFEELLNTDRAEYKLNATYYSGLLYHDNQGNYVIILSSDNEDGVAELQNLRNILVGAFFASIVCILILGRVFAKQILHPISQITKKVNSIRAENLNQRLENVNKGNDELGELIHTFNSMLDRLQIYFDLQNNFINNASHELRNPLTAILGQTEIALNKERTPEQYHKTLENIQLEASRLDAMVNGLLNLAKTDFQSSGLLVEGLRMDEVILEIKQSIDISNPANQIKLNFEHLPDDPEALSFLGNKTLINVALGNIIVNACKFSDNQPVEVKLMMAENRIMLTVTDQGVGIPQDELINIYEPFYRGSNVRDTHGFGFGLPMAYRIIKIHSGDIMVSSQVGKGTIVKVSLPNKMEPFL